MKDYSLLPLGQTALRVAFPPRIDRDLNARVVALARLVESASIRGVHDVVPTYCAVTVHFNPLVTDALALYQIVTDIAAASEAHPGKEASGQAHIIPVFYGGADGPDLEAVARQVNMTAAELVALHAGSEYRVFMTGFVPGFAYLGPLDPRLSVPRRETPRVEVPAGSVAIAGGQTGIYPIASPGGWHIIGRTPLPLFDPGRSTPFRLRAGDRVRFDPLAATAQTTFPAVRLGGAPPLADGMPEPDRPNVHPSPSRPAVVVRRAGLLTTVQDRGRRGFQALGVPESGPMDAAAHRLANRLVGNRDDAATLEVTLTGPELLFEDARVVAVTGAEFNLMRSGEPIEHGIAIAIPQGATLSFGARRWGARAYVAISGGIDVPPVLASRSTHLLSGLGGFEGRALKAGDRLPLGEFTAVAEDPARTGRRAGTHAVNTPRLRILPGPDVDRLGPGVLAWLTAAPYTVQVDSNRMGCRLHGKPFPVPAGGAEMISDSTVTGAVQMLPSGQPVVLMADRQTTGGYPIPAVVIAADLPRAGQLAPGDTVTFAVVPYAEAVTALIAQERAFVRAAGAA